MAAQLRQTIAADVEACVEKYGRRPKLAVILVGEDPGSTSYVRSKGKAAVEVGFEYLGIHKPDTITESELLDIVAELNQDDSVDGILVQLPLPNHINEDHIIDAIHPDKDVDGLTPINFGRMFLGERSFRPCTPSGIMAILDAMECEIEGKHAVVVGRSKLVGTPVARLLQDANATVTICHSRTKDLRRFTKEADILIAAVGKAKMFDASYIKEGAYVVDVGVNRLDDGHLCGDVDFDDVRDYCTAITPVPKGVGPMTITMLLKNTLIAYRERTW